MRSKALLFAGALASIVLLLVTGCQQLAAPTGASSTAPKVVKWNISIGFPKSSYMVPPVETWAKDMDMATNGGWKITINTDGTLAKTDMGLDGIKSGLFEGALVSAAYNPSKMPYQSGFGLPFMAPLDIAQGAELLWALENHATVRSWMEKNWNAIPLLPSVNQNHEIMSTKRIVSADDFKGVRIRTLPDFAKVLQKFGAVPVDVAVGDMYTAVERGTIDAVTSFPTSLGAYGIHEVAKYYVPQVSLGNGGGSVWVSKTAWDALPQNYRDLVTRWGQEKAIKEGVAAFNAGDLKFLPLFYKKLQVTDFAPDQRARLMDASKSVYEEWVAARAKEGLAGKEILDFMLSKR